jgi:D-alanyl-D-alanine carboxypeptidase
LHKEIVRKKICSFIRRNEWQTRSHPFFPLPTVIMVSAITLVCTFLSGCSGSGDGRLANAEKLQASVDSSWSDYKDQHGVPGGGLNVYIETPAGNYFAASGMPAGTGSNTHFRVASNTKSFTSAAIMLLYQQGKLGIDDTIGSAIPGRAIPYVPATSAYDIPNKGSITIRQLMNHTAGVFDVTNEYAPDTCPAPYAGRNYLLYVREDLGDYSHQFSPEELINVNAVCQSTYFVPGGGYHYSNTGYSLLAVIIERVSGLSYDQFITQNLIIPNTLSSTSVPVLATDKTIPAPYADGYLFANGAFIRVTEDNMSGNIAEGNIISTPTDLARWIRRLIRGEAGLDAASVGIMKTATAQSATMNYGCGIQYYGSLGYGHTGAHSGYLSLMAYDPVTDVTVISYFNVWDDANLVTTQAALLFKAAEAGRKAVGY